jgi:hypothetical protein
MPYLPRVAFMKVILPSVTGARGGVPFDHRGESGLHRVAVQCSALELVIYARLTVGHILEPDHPQKGPEPKAFGHQSVLRQAAQGRVNP